MVQTPLKNRQALLLCLIGPTAGGKTSVSKSLLTEYEDTLALSISATTRSPREHELNGRDYYFIDEQEFKKRIQASEFIEWEENHGYLYGTPKSIVDQNLKDILFDIDIKGALKLKSIYPSRVVVLFFVPPTFDELVRRLNKRGKVSPEEQTVRFQTMEKEYSLLLQNKAIIDYFIVNDCFEEACSAARSILHAERNRLCRISTDYLTDILQVGKL